MTRDTFIAEEEERAKGWIDYIKKPVRHLDIGSSTGRVLRTIGASGQAGVEPGPWGREYGAYDSLSQVEGQFDLVTALHVLEHVVDPVGFLRPIRKLACGPVCIEVPKPPGWGWPHLTAYRNDSLLKIMEMAEMPGRIAEDAFHIKAMHNA